MKRISGTFGVEQGSKLLFSDFANGGPMWSGHGDRESRHQITFAEPFRQSPSVMVAIAMWDVDHKHNARIDLTTDKITRKGFELVFRTWGDTRVARIRADWTAFGALRDDEDWEID